jgi:hypothetical protein
MQDWVNGLDSDAVPSPKNSGQEDNAILQMSVPHTDMSPEPHPPRPPLRDRTYVFIALVAAILTLATGWLSSTISYSPAGFISQGYGFPFAWKEVDASCPPPCIQANGTFYNWFAFAGDLLFFIAITYLIVLYSLRKRQALRTVLESRKLLGLLALVVIALAADNYAYDSVYGTGNHWTGYEILELDHYSFQNANLLTLWIRNYGPGAVTLTNLSITDGSGAQAAFPISVSIDPNTMGSISENTTGQGLRLTQSGVYKAAVITSRNVQMTFTASWT